MRVLPLLLLSVLALAACGRNPSSDGSPGTSPAETRAAAKAAKAASAEAHRLRDITEAWYDQYLQLNPLTATAQGDHRYDARFGDYASERWITARQ
jgi:hypothetical protein